MNKTIIYDGNCKFCTHFANWSIKQNSNLQIISVRDKEAKEMLRNNSIQFIDLQTIYYINDAVVYIRSQAVFNIAKEFKYPWKLISIFHYLPTKLTDYFYKLFAKYRYYF